MGNREKSPGNGGHNVAKVVTTVGVTGLVAAAGITAAVIKRRRQSDESKHKALKGRLRELQTYAPDDQGRTPEVCAAFFKRTDLSYSSSLPPEFAARIYVSTTSADGEIASDKLRAEFGEDIDDTLFHSVITDLETNGLIKVDLVETDEGEQLSVYKAKPALDWAITQSSDFPLLADAVNTVLHRGYESTGWV